MKQLSTVGIDIGGTNTVLGIVDTDGNCHAKTEFHTQRHTSSDGPVFFDEYMELFCSTIHKLIVEVEESSEVIGIGVGAPDVDSFKGRIVGATNLYWKDRNKPDPNDFGNYQKQYRCDIVRLLKKRFPSIKAIAMTNDANAAAMGELYFGGGKSLKKKDLVEITLGTGLGSGFVSNGDIIYGHNSFAGELGHIIVERDGRYCGCHNSGCLETYGSATGIRRTALDLIDNSGIPSSLRKIERSALTTKDIGDAAAQGDKLALETFDITGRYLAQGIATAIAITGPEAVFLFGGPTKCGDILMNPIKKYLDKYLLNNFRDTKVMFSKLGEDAAIKGAAALAWQLVKENKAGRARR